MALIFAAGICEVQSAHAACTNNPPATGQTVNCTGTGNIAVIAPAGVTGVNVNIPVMASITGVAVTTTGTNAQYSNVLVNDSSTITNSGTIRPTLPATSRQRDYVGVNLNGANTTLINNGTIDATNPATTPGSATYRLYGVISSAPDGATFSNVQVTNNGTISVSQSGTGIARSIYAGENMDSMQIDNFGTISATRVGNPTAITAVATVDADDDTDTLVVNNHANATMTATGANTFTVGGRAQDYTIQNDGTITNTGGRAAILVYGGSDDGPASTTIDNSKSGVVNGNVYVTELTPITAGGVAAVPGAGLAGTDISRDSAITNEGAINGAVFLGMGTHTLDNTGSISGGITVDQTVPVSAARAATATAPAIAAGAVAAGGQSFTFTNEGTLGGDITIIDQSTSVNSITLTDTGFAGNVIARNGTGSNSLVLDGVTNLASIQKFSSLDLTTSLVSVTNGVSLVNNSTLMTTVYGAGGTMTAPSLNAGSIVGTLTSGGTTTVVASFQAVVRNGDSYQLASTATGTFVTSEGTGLVSTSVSNANGPLVLTAAVRDASSVSGISRPGAQTINGLINSSSSNAHVQTLGITVEGLGSDADVAQAGKALSPIVNGADIQTPINSTMLFHQQIDSRLDQFAYGQLPVSGRSADLGVARPVPVYGVLPTGAGWIEGIGGGANQSSVAGVDGYTSTLVGVIGGYDQIVLPNIKVGAAFGYIDAQINNNANLTTRERIDTYQGLAYAEFAPGIYYVRGSVGYGGVDYHSTRSVSFAGFSDVAVDNHGGNVLTARGEAGLPYAIYGDLIVPYAGFTYTHLTQDAYTETSGAGTGLAYQGVSNDSERSEIGGKVIVPLLGAPVFSYFFPAGTSSVAIEARAAYVHEFGNVGQTVIGAFSGGNFFTVNGPVPDRDMIDFGVGLKMASGPVQLDLSYNGLARSTYYEQVGLLRARYVF